MFTILQKLHLIREKQLGEFEASIQPRIEEEKPKEKKRRRRRGSRAIQEGQEGTSKQHMRTEANNTKQNNCAIAHTILCCKL